MDIKNPLLIFLASNRYTSIQRACELYMPIRSKNIFTHTARAPRALFISLLVAKCTVYTVYIQIVLQRVYSCTLEYIPVPWAWYGRTTVLFVNFCKILYETNFKMVCLPVWSSWCDGQFLCFARGRSWVRTQPRTKFLPFESTARPQPSTTNRISFDFPSPFFDFASSFRINPFRLSRYPYLDKIQKFVARVHVTLVKKKENQVFIEGKFIKLLKQFTFRLLIPATLKNLLVVLLEKYQYTGTVPTKFQIHRV